MVIVLGFILLAAAAVNPAGWVPARWGTADPASLELVKGTPVNCLLLERPLWAREFTERAAATNIAVLGVLHPGADLIAGAAAAREAKLAGLVLEGDFPREAAGRLRDSVPIAIELAPRAAMRFDGPVAGTYQGVWPGIHVDNKAAATGGPWVDTNSGFLAYARAAARPAPVWIANRPPDNAVLKPEKYMHAISDAAIAGARWVLALDRNFQDRLLAREPAAVRDWGRIMDYLRFYEDRRDWLAWLPAGQLAVVQDAPGAMYSGGVLDMIATKHTPVRAVPVRRLGPDALDGARMAVSVDPDALDASGKDVLRAFTRGGGTLLTAPPDSKFPPPGKEDLTLPKEQIEKLDAVWKDINSMIGRSNLGVRLFNVAGMLSALSSSGNRLLLHLVNYTDYPVENVTAHVLGKYSKATLFEPGTPGRALDVYAVEGGTGIDLAQVGPVTMVVLE